MISIYKKTIRDEGIRQLKEPVVGSWVSVTGPKQGEISKVTAQYGIPEDFIHASLDEEEIARIETDEGITILILKIPNRTAVEINTIPFGIIITGDLIMTVCTRDHPLIEDLRSGKVRNFFTTTKTKFILQVIQRITAYYLYYLQLIEKQADDVERRLHTSVGNKEIIKLLGFERTLLYFNRGTVANNNIVERLLKGNVVELYEEDRDLLDDISFDIKQSIEMIGIYSGILSSTMDAYASIVSNNLNIVLKFLAAFTIILSFPVMIASFYGMNVDVPFGDHPNAFYIITAVSLLITILIAYIFARKNYL